VCIDANFTQKHLSGVYDDSDVHYACSFFLSNAKVIEMESYIEAAQAGKNPVNLDDLLLSDEVLEQCEKSFVAAQEKIAKASRVYFADTGLMALVCQHDRLLW